MFHRHVLFVAIVFCHEHLYWARTVRLANRPTPPKLRPRQKEIFTTSDGKGPNGIRVKLVIGSKSSQLVAYWPKGGRTQ